jgi:hypothetical protein
MDVNTEAAIICVSALMSLFSSLLLAGFLFGFIPRIEWPSCNCCADDNNDDSGTGCIILMLRWFCYKYCCCCRSRYRFQDWLKEDLRKLEISDKFGPFCCQAAIQHVVTPEHLSPTKCSKTVIVKCQECNQSLVCKTHEEWKDKTVCECVKKMSPE